MLAGLLAPDPAAAQDEMRPLSWSLVGATPGRTAVVIAPVELRDDAVVAVSAEPGGAFRIDLSVSTAPQPIDPEPESSLMVPPKPTYTIRLPSRLTGQRIVGEHRADTLFDSYSWNLWHGGTGIAGEANLPLKAPRLVGLSAQDAKRILVNELDVPASHVRIRGPRSGFVARQVPSRSGTIDPRSTRVTLTMRATHPA